MVNDVRRQRGREGRPCRRHGDRDVLVALLMNMLLMAFSLAAVALSQPTLALVVGTGSVSLARLLTQRLLS
ncbi:hypothetical protein ACPCHT_32175 [Nucisporomicrobium flavum]|uniref:hypothetical protein n=1 Tax=Nucisporomicrobium flavum TaxID=2785915 RepID=UPI003C300C7E